VTITNPKDGRNYPLEDNHVRGTITFFASASDPEDGDLIAKITWRLDPGGVIYTGTSLFTSITIGWAEKLIVRQGHGTL
jgi:hypothetical protein